MYKIRKRIAVFTAQPDSLYQTELLKGINSEAFRLDYDTMIFSTVLKKGGSKDFQTGEKQIFCLANPELMDAVIIVPDVIQIDGALEYIEEHIIQNFDGPVVYINAYGKADKLCVREHSEQAFEQLIGHLYEVHGCRKFALMLGFKGHDHTNSRRDSIFRALADRNLSVSEDDIYYGDFWYDKGEEVANAILEKEELPDAVICISDTMALSLIRAFEQKGVSVPQDIIVTGFDLTGSGSNELFKVTSIHLNSVSLGEEAVRKAVGLDCSDMEIDGGQLVKCTSCGCRTNVSKKFVYADTVRRSAYDESDTFYSGYNFMNEALISTVDLLDLLWKVDWYTTYIGKCTNVAICLNELFCKIMKEEEIEDDSGTYSDRIYLALDHHASQAVDMDRSFSVKEMYPKLFIPRNEPCSYFFAPLHFNQYTYGYTVTENKDPDSPISPCYSQWLRNCTIALESLKQKHHLKLLYKKFEESTTKDHSTGLYSRNGFNLYAGDMLERAVSYEVSFVFLIGDLNCLKYINDRFGHIHGDKAIFMAARAMSLDFIGEDVYEQKNFRIGGDEFVQIIIGKITEAEIKQHLERIRKFLDEFNTSSGLPYPVYLSMGYEAHVPTSADTIDGILSIADKYLFKNKEKMKRETGFDFKRED